MCKSRCCQSISSYITDQDEIVSPSANSLHFQTDQKQKTFIGGIISFMVTLYMVYTAFVRGKQMLQFEDPTLTSIEEGMNYQQVGKISILDVAKPLFEIQQYGDNTVDLDVDDYRKYIHVRLNNIIKTFDENGEMKRENVYYPIYRCQEDNFQANEFSQKYWKQVKDSRYQYCVDNEEIYLQGTRDSTTLKQDHAYIVYEIWRCTDDPERKLDGYPDCAPPDQIKNWMQTKFATFKIINQKINFITRLPFAVRNNEMFIPSIPLKWGKFSDTGYRFRYNDFQRYDYWWSNTQIHNQFYDFLFYNSDTFDVPMDQNLAAEMYFRLEVDQIQHERVVFTSMDFVGSLGGVSDFMLQVAGWVLGGYAAFHQTYATMKVLYKIRRPESDEQIFELSKQEDQIEPNIENIKLPLCQKIKLYFGTTCFACCCCLSKKQRKQLQIIQECQERLEEEFDIARLIEKQRDALYDLQLIKEKLNLENDSVFEKVNPLGIVNHNIEEEELIIEKEEVEMTKMPPKRGAKDYGEDVYNFEPKESEEEYSESYQPRIMQQRNRQQRYRQNDVHSQPSQPRIDMYQEESEPSDSRRNQEQRQRNASEYDDYYSESYQEPYQKDYQPQQRNRPQQQQRQGSPKSRRMSSPRLRQKFDR